MRSIHFQRTIHTKWQETKVSRKEQISITKQKPYCTIISLAPDLTMCTVNHTTRTQPPPPCPHTTMFTRKELTTQPLVHIPQCSHNKNLPPNPLSTYYNVHITKTYHPTPCPHTTMVHITRTFHPTPCPHTTMFT